MLSLKDSTKESLSQALLPIGFPKSVTGEYLTYQWYDTIQVGCADLRSIILIHYSLLSRGVGNVNISALDIVVEDIWMGLLTCVVSLVICNFYLSEKSARYMKRWRVLSSISSALIACIIMVKPYISGVSFAVSP
eukprot:UN05257